MQKRVVFKVNLFFFLFVWNLRKCNCFSEVIFEGRKYVAEGYPFSITCLKSSYGVPKWTRNGLTIDPLDPEYVMTQESFPNDGIRMELRVEKALWKHRGHYKCDPLSKKSHEIEIVPSRESEQELSHQARVQLRPNRTLKLVCDQEENAVFPINWYKDGSRILESPETPRIRMEGRVLSISKATESDSGEYMCVIEMAGLSYPFADHLGSRIKVTYPSRVKKFPTQIRPILHRNWSVECEVQGFPVPRVSWFIDGLPIEEFRLNDSRYDVIDNPEGLPNSVLFINEVQYEDNREITCIADNVDGPDQTIAQLAVRSKSLFEGGKEKCFSISVTCKSD
ncbi:hemicentin-1 [Nephila pilipes]|uniref:Hemicentin-1 n=1 Tax=Nephila pilipes TaxID=299642 RepID=A0A8X6QV71_NEPPI|nr:hemicentin-1 [Nephila pilipes]